jgi:hypothetical protein
MFRIWQSLSWLWNSILLTDLRIHYHDYKIPWLDFMVGKLNLTLILTSYFLGIHSNIIPLFMPMSPKLFCCIFWLQFYYHFYYRTSLSYACVTTFYTSPIWTHYIWWAINIFSFLVRYYFPAHVFFCLLISNILINIHS